MARYYVEKRTCDWGGGGVVRGVFVQFNRLKLFVAAINVTFEISLKKRISDCFSSVFNGHAMEPLLMQSHRDMRKKYEELEDKYRKLEDKVVTQKQQIKSMQHQKQEEAEQVEKQNQLKSVRKQLEKIKHDIKLREKLQASLPKVSSHYATTYPAYHSKYQPVLTSSDPYYYSQKDLMLHQEVDLLHKELNALDAMKYHLHY